MAFENARSRANTLNRSCMAGSMIHGVTRWALTKYPHVSLIERRQWTPTFSKISSSAWGFNSGSTLGSPVFAIGSPLAGHRIPLAGRLNPTPWLRGFCVNMKNRASYCLFKNLRHYTDTCCPSAFPNRKLQLFIHSNLSY